VAGQNVHPGRQKVSMVSAVRYSIKKHIKFTRLNTLKTHNSMLKGLTYVIINRVLTNFDKIIHIVEIFCLKIKATNRTNTGTRQN